MEESTNIPYIIHAAFVPGRILSSSSQKGNPHVLFGENTLETVGETDHHLLGASGSMYTFNRIDQRLQRLMEASIFIFESFAGLDHKYEHLGLAKFQLH